MLYKTPVSIDNSLRETINYFSTHSKDDMNNSFALKSAEETAGSEEY